MPRTPDALETAGLASESPRDDPRYDTRRVVVFFLGLAIFYGGVVAIVRPGETDISKVAIGLMAAPTVGALAAVLLARGRIQFGRVTWHVVLAFVPPAVIVSLTWVASLFTDVEVQSENLIMLLALAPLVAITGSISAVGEEIGWRGFLWPLFRRRLGFWLSAAVMLPIWWLYHLPAVLLWGYGFNAGLPAFTVAIAGFVLFVGVLTDRSRAIWPSVLAHGAWNGMVATAYSVGGDSIPVCTSTCPDFAGEDYLFTGSQRLLGEFGWIPAISMLAIGLVAAWWHMRRPVPLGDPGPT